MLCKVSRWICTSCDRQMMGKNNQKKLGKQALCPRMSLARVEPEHANNKRRRYRSLHCSAYPSEPSAFLAATRGHGGEADVVPDTNHTWAESKVAKVPFPTALETDIPAPQPPGLFFCKRLFRGFMSTSTHQTTHHLMTISAGKDFTRTVRAGRSTTVLVSAEGKFLPQNTICLSHRC